MASTPPEPTWLSRRNLLAAAAALPLRALAKPPNPFFAFCMDTHDEKKRDLAAQARMLKDLGYDGAGHLWFDHVAERLATLDREGLALFQIYLRIDLRPEAKPPYDPRLHEVLGLIDGRGTQLAALVTGGPPSDPSLDGRAVDMIREIADAARPHHVKLALYPHQKNWIETVGDAIRVARKANRANAGVMFNLCHWLKTEDERELPALLAAASPYLLAVSINGSDRGAEIRAGTGKWIQPLGSGTFDMFGFLRELDHLGYPGPIGLQCYGLPGDAAVHLRQSISAWRTLLRRREAAS